MGLILASKISPRDIGCCEQALGQALDSRLWAGKKEVITGSDHLSFLEPSSQAQRFVAVENLLFLYSRVLPI